MEELQQGALSLGLSAEDFQVGYETCQGLYGSTCSIGCASLYTYANSLPNLFQTIILPLALLTLELTPKRDYEQTQTSSESLEQWLMIKRFSTKEPP